MPKATAPDAEQLVHDYADLLNGDFSKLDVLSKSYTFYGPGVPEEGLTRDAFEEYVRGNREAFPDLEYTVDEMLASDEVIMSEWTVTGTHEGEFNGIPPTGRKIEFNTMGTQRITDGKIGEERGYYDPQEMLAQLGVTDDGGGASQ